MSLNLYLNEAKDPEKALAISAANPLESRMKELVFGETHATNIYIVDGVGTYSSASGAVSSTVKVGIGIPGGRPTEGTFTLSGEIDDDPFTTAALNYNATAAQIQAALEGVTGIVPGDVEVTGEFPAWQVEFIGNLENTAIQLMTGDGDLLFPISDVNVSRVQAGGGGQNEVQFINVKTRTAWLNSSWSRFAGPPAGWAGALSPNGLGVFQMFGGRSSIQAVLEIRVTDASGNPRSYGYLPFKLLQTLIPPSSLTTPAENTTQGQAAIASGTDIVTVTGLALSLTPSAIIFTMVKPNGGLNLFASLVDGSLTADGFVAHLSGNTDNANYKLGYTLIF